MLVAQVQRVLNAAEARSIPPSVGLAREVLDGVAPGSPDDARAGGRARRPSGPRSSGIVAPTAGGVRSREKMVWEWPELGDRVLEDWR
jgi:hypothetical protein